LNVTPFNELVVTPDWFGETTLGSSCYPAEGQGEVPLEPVYFKHAAEVRDSPNSLKFFKILRIEMKYYSHHHDNGRRGPGGTTPEYLNI
jgi:hypothetical protein